MASGQRYLAAGLRENKFGLVGLVWFGGGMAVHLAREMLSQHRKSLTQSGLYFPAKLGTMCVMYVVKVC